MFPISRSAGRAIVIVATALILSACAQKREGVDKHRYVPVPNTQHLPSTGRMEYGMEAYAEGRYKVALEYYKLGARWADKFAQFNVGLMYVRGQGVDAQPARGWAWLELSAERDYPQFAGPADKLYSMLNEKQRMKGRRILQNELLPKYGDAVAIDRTAARMRHKRAKSAGSNTGYVGFMTVIDPDRMNTSDGVHYYAEENWNVRKIIAQEKTFMKNMAKGRIRLRDFETLDEEEDPDENRVEESEQ